LAEEVKFTVADFSVRREALERAMVAMAKADAKEFGDVAEQFPIIRGVREKTIFISALRTVQSCRKNAKKLIFA